MFFADLVARSANGPRSNSDDRRRETRDLKDGARRDDGEDQSAEDGAEDLGTREDRAARGEHPTSLRFGCAHRHQRRQRHVQHTDRDAHDHENRKEIAHVFDEADESHEYRDHEGTPQRRRRTAETSCCLTFAEATAPTMLPTPKLVPTSPYMRAEECSVLVMKKTSATLIITSANKKTTNMIDEWSKYARQRKAPASRRRGRAHPSSDARARDPVVDRSRGTTCRSPPSPKLIASKYIGQLCPSSPTSRPPRPGAGDRGDPLYRLHGRVRGREFSSPAIFGTSAEYPGKENATKQLSRAIRAIVTIVPCQRPIPTQTRPSKKQSMTNSRFTGVWSMMKPEIGDKSTSGNDAAIESDAMAQLACDPCARRR